MASSSLQRLGLLLLSLILLDLTQALSLVNPPALNLAPPTNTTLNANIRVPGKSPFVYIGSHSKNIFDITSLTMSPNPCRLRSDCQLTAQGTILSSLPSIRLNLEITSDFAGQPEPIFLVEDDFCNWVDVSQNGVRSCPPTKGPATMSFKMLLMQGWIPEAKYGIDVSVTGEKGALVSHIYADLQLKDPVRMSSSSS